MNVLTRYQRRMRSPARHFCPCGEVAVRYIRGGWGCARCIAIEESMEFERERMSLLGRERREGGEVA